MHKKIALAVLALLVLVVALFVWGRPSAEDRDSGDIDEQPTINDISYNATKISKEGSFNEALTYYDKQVESTGSNEEKITVLIKKSRFALGEGKNTEAVEAAKQAYDIEESDRTTRALADAYAAKGDKDQAITYYKKLLETSKASDESGGMVARGPSIEQIISELEK